MAFMDERMKIESAIGFTIGILIGAIAGGVLILFFTPWEWYFKLFSFVGSVGIIGSLSLTLYEQFKIRKNYLITMAEMKKIQEESPNIIAEEQNTQ
jgi:MFS family permease